MYKMDFDEQLQLGHLLLFERECRVCGEKKNLIESFYRTRKNVKLESSYSYECKECTIKRILEKRKIHIRFNEYNRILAEQNNCCAICGTLQAGRKYNSFSVDRNPKTNAVRGLVCKSCGIILNQVGDNLQTLENMIEYLKNT